MMRPMRPKRPKRPERPERLELHPPQRRRRLATLALVLCMAASLPGCELLGLDGGAQAPSGQPAPGQAPPARPPQAKAPEAEAKEEVVEYQRPEYPENLRRNPFSPSDAVLMPIMGTAVEGDGEDDRPLEPLEQFSLAQLRLVAIISEIAVPKAMFLDPDGFGHVVKQNDRVGRGGGVIVDIRENEVDVREISGDDDERQSKITTIRLRSMELKAENADELSEAEREALERLLNTDEGRRALRRNINDRAAGANAIEGQDGGTLPPSGSGGVAPP